jgi:hypothetical protein
LHEKGEDVTEDQATLKMVEHDKENAEAGSTVAVATDCQRGWQLGPISMGQIWVLLREQVPYRNVIFCLHLQSVWGLKSPVNLSAGLMKTSI